MYELNWLWIGLMAVVPPLLGLLVAYPLWRRNETIFGSLLGAAVIFGWGMALMFREHFELERLVQACLESSDTCWPSPTAFTRYSVYACLALVEVFGVFAVSLSVERRIRNRRYAPEWR